ncbi:YhzD family protein [Pseudogracilibacillus auburnensis]|uniref:YhzD-like protein n=1 Tax=Pseudogracilibacillus auburnensis TaxID=1494959 RepID=A0A2V3VY89_9BACI|nr:YhzD family protein [Pseudogracilibacillus auburnensis]MBO1002908.1 hypothetical protein [Pseudogracilibacillus auburnensis]PXW87003.1 YhzD-like protein [Pseudogracilibacillus auburnensis]
MKNYVLTVFSKAGEKLLDESFTAKNDDEAKSIGEKRLEEENYSENTHRCVTDDARLILFHR